MDFGKKINELRKSKNVTQDEMAAELGVTAAAVSKWENNYTLPDILMLCALADYFGVTTDELLGRGKEMKSAVIAAETQELGQKIAAAARDHGMITQGIYNSFHDALAAAQTHSEIQYLLVGFRRSLTREESESVEEPMHLCQSISDSDEQILKGMEMYFRNFM